MNWKNLKNNKCPKCSSPLKDIGHYYACSLNGCIFSINKPKFEQLVNDLYKPKKYKSIDDNLAELNNLGREMVTEDFSDSPYLDY